MWLVFFALSFFDLHFLLCFSSPSVLVRSPSYSLLSCRLHYDLLSINQKTIWKRMILESAQWVCNERTKEKTNKIRVLFCVSLSVSTVRRRFTELYIHFTNTIIYRISSPPLLAWRHRAWTTARTVNPKVPAKLFSSTERMLWRLCVNTLAWNSMVES